MPEPKPGRLYGNPKDHKQCIPDTGHPPLREVVSNSGSNTQNLGKICTYYIRPVNVQTISYVKDTAHVLRRIKKLNDKGPQAPGTFPFTMDIVAMYPSVPVQIKPGCLEESLAWVCCTR